MFLTKINNCAKRDWFLKFVWTFVCLNGKLWSALCNIAKKIFKSYIICLMILKALVIFNLFITIFEFFNIVVSFIIEHFKTENWVSQSS